MRYTVPHDAESVTNINNPRCRIWQVYVFAASRHSVKKINTHRPVIFQTMMLIIVDVTPVKNANCVYAARERQNSTFD